MATITITAGGKEGAYRGDPGVYIATLVSHSIEGPFDSKQTPGEKFHLNEWGFAIDGAPDAECMVWLTSGMATGPRSKTFAVITALAGGKEPEPGMDIDTDRLMGRQVQVNVQRNDKGYLDVVGIMPVPTKPAAGAKPAATPAPGSDDSPF